MIQEVQKRKIILTPDLSAALQNVLAETGTDIWLVVLPEARTTLPKEKLYCQGKQVLENMLSLYVYR